MAGSKRLARGCSLAPRKGPQLAARQAAGSQRLAGICAMAGGKHFAGGCSSALRPSPGRWAVCVQWGRWDWAPMQDKVLLGAVCSTRGRAAWMQ